MYQRAEEVAHDLFADGMTITFALNDPSPLLSPHSEINPAISGNAREFYAIAHVSEKKANEALKLDWIK
jgi:hypothetical protein